MMCVFEVDDVAIEVDDVAFEIDDVAFEIDDVAAETWMFDADIDMVGARR